MQYLRGSRTVARFNFGGDFDGGAKRDRTADLLVANEALSQLSYSPTNGNDLLILAGLPVLQTLLDAAEELV